MKNRLIYLFAFLIVGIGMQSCKTASVMPDAIKNNTLSSNAETKGRQLIQDVIDANGYTAYNDASTYTFEAVDNWKTMFALMGQDITPDEQKLTFHLRPNSFDGQIYIHNKKTDKIDKKLGIQSWYDYEITESNEVKYDVALADKKTVRTALPNFQYIVELPNRLVDVPFVRYLGKETRYGKEYETVYASWGDENVNDYDQFILYIDPSTHRIEAAHFTVKETYPPFPKVMPFTYLLREFKEVDGGVTIPTVMHAMVGEGSEDESKALHYLTIDAASFQFDKVALSSILINPNLSDNLEVKPF